MIGLLYVSLPMTTAQLHWPWATGGFDPRRVFCLIFFVWAADTGAYFAGKNFGKHKLAPSISPGKTWEGWAGGAALTLATGWAAGYFLPDIPLSHRLVAAGVVAVFGPLGDLAESYAQAQRGREGLGHLPARPRRPARPLRCLFAGAAGAGLAASAGLG
ncbi:MAG: phosphatidate cytidylyltransferase [Hymenobacter sp.]